MTSARSLRSLQMAYGLALVLLVGITGLAGTVGLVLSERWSGEARRIESLLRLAEEARGDLYRQTKEVFDYHFLDDPEAAGQYRAFGEALAAKLAELEALARPGAEQAVVADLMAAQRGARADADAIMARDSGDFAEAEKLALFDTELEVGSLARVEAALAATADRFLGARRALERRVERLTGIAFAVLTVAVAAAAILLLFARGVLRRAFVAPLSELLAALAAFGAGRLERPIEERGAAEMVTLQRAINQMTREVTESRAALVRAEKQAALGALVPVIAHNIRNPLASIRATAQVLPGSRGDPEATASGVRGIIAAVDRLNGWLTSLLSYLDPAGARRRTGSLAGCADNALALLAPKLAEKDISVTRHDWLAGGNAELDAELMEQAIFGLLVNAAEASPAGAALDLAAGGDAATSWLAITDHGPGMPFTPSAAATVAGPTTKTWGSGLGIPFATKVCELHEGTLAFDRPAAGGTRVTLTLPAASP